QGWGVYQQHYDSEGHPVGGEQRVNTYRNGDQKAPSVAHLPPSETNASGGWVVVWSSYGQDGSEEGIFQQRFTPVGAFGAGREAGTGSTGDDLF
ncbi:hypothetical protein ABKV84_23465, partial [Enterobacter hormaechei]